MLLVYKAFRCALSLIRENYLRSTRQHIKRRLQVLLDLEVYEALSY